MYTWNNSEAGESILAKHSTFIIFASAATSALIMAMLLHTYFNDFMVENPLINYILFGPAFGIGFLYGLKISEKALQPSETRSALKRKIIKIFLFFAAVSFTSFEETQDIAVVFLGFTATFFYTLRSYIKYVTLSIRAENDLEYFKNGLNTDVELSAGPSFSLRKNLLWFLREQRKFFQFDEGVFVFLISAALLLHELLPLLWILAISQLYYGLMKALQRGLQIQKSKYREMSHHFKK